MTATSKGLLRKNIFLCGLTFILFTWVSISTASENDQMDSFCPSLNMPQVFEALKLEMASSSFNPSPGLSVAWKCEADAVQNIAMGSTSVWSWAGKVSSETAFDAASLGKPITAFLVLKLVERGQLNLDDPITKYLTPEQLPLGESQSFQGVTVSQLLSHTSGLPNMIWQWDAPRNEDAAGKFQYSGNGFMLLQKIIENISGSTFEVVAMEQIFQPLGMFHSSFGESFETDTILANGHVPPDIPGSIFFGGFWKCFLLAALIIGGMSLKIRPLRVHWAASLVAITLIAFSLVANQFVVQLGFGAFRFLLWFSGIPILLAIVVAICVGFLLHKTRISSWAHYQYARLPLAIVVFFTAFFTIQMSVRSLELVPVPQFFGKYPVNAASSLHSTPSDMVKFIDQFRFSTTLSTDLIEQMSTSVVNLEPGKSWGLGIGIEEAKRIETDDPIKILWQWGDNPGSQSLAIALPEQGISIVLMSNRWFSLDKLRDIAQQLLLIDAQLNI